MTLEEYTKIRDEATANITKAREAYHAAIAPLNAQIAEAQQSAIDAAPFKVGDVVLAKHDRGHGWKPTEKCQITKVSIHGWRELYYCYYGVKTKKDGTFGTRSAFLGDVQPFVEQEAK